MTYTAITWFADAPRRRLKSALLGCVLLAAPMPTVAAPLTDCIEQNLPAAARARQFEMQTATADGSQTLGGTLYLRANGDEVAMTLQIDRPLDLRDSAFLFRRKGESEQMFVYLSAIGRTRRISGSAADASFFGSALRYSDLHTLIGSFGGAARRELPAAQYDGGPVRVLEIAGEAQTARVAVDAKTCVPLHLEIEHDGTVIRELNAERSAIQQDEGRWYLSAATMQDHERQVSTTVRMQDFRGYEQIPDNIFNPSQFYRARFSKP